MDRLRKGSARNGTRPAHARLVVACAASRPGAVRGAHQCGRDAQLVVARRAARRADSGRGARAEPGRIPECARDSRRSGFADRRYRHRSRGREHRPPRRGARDRRPLRRGFRQRTRGAGNADLRPVEVAGREPHRARTLCRLGVRAAGRHAAAGRARRGSAAVAAADRRRPRRLDGRGPLRADARRADVLPAVRDVRGRNAPRDRHHGRRARAQVARAFARAACHAHAAHRRENGRDRSAIPCSPSRSR